MRSPVLALVGLAPALAFAQEPALAEPLPAPAEERPTRFDSDQQLRITQPSRDLFAMGQQVTVDAEVEDNALVMGQVVEVRAPVRGDLLAMGQTILIAAPVAGDVYAMGQSLVVTSGGSVGGRVYGLAETVELGGPVAGDLSVGAGRLVLKAPVAGDVELEVGEILLGSGAAVAGDLSYQAHAAMPELDEVVAGEVTFTQKIEQDEEEAPPTLLQRLTGFTLWTLWSYGSQLLVGFAFLALGGEAAGRVARGLLDQPARAAGLGFVLTAALPVASLLAIVTLLPLPLGVLGLLGFGVLLYAGQLLAAQAVGDLILRRMRPEALGNPYISMAVGLAPLVLLGQLPWLGTLQWLVATVCGAGALWMALPSRR